jgi:4-amino-4-deoxy-L-arabinose transferase-like glycosyltransferase
VNARSGWRSKPLTLLGLALAICWLVALAPRHLAKTDEGRYAEISREMVQSGDWITPRLDGIKYFEKPALQYWATALADEVLGVSEFSARLWTGLTGLIGLAALGLAARRVYGRATAISAVAVLASSVLYLVMGHIDTLDMGLTGFMTVTLAGLLASQFSGRASDARLVYVAWAGAALAILSKGLIGLVLPGAAAVLYILIERDWRMLERVRIGSGLLLLLAISAPWFVLVSRANPEFPHFFFIHEHVERFLTHEHNRVGPWWYFIPVLAFGALPWLSVLPQALARVWLAAVPASPDLQRQAKADRLLFIWAVFIFVFFSASGSKLPSYILPIMPALALLIARALRVARLPNLVAHARIVLALALAALLFGLFASHLAGAADERLAYQELGHFLAAGCALLAAGAYLAARAFNRGLRERGVLLLAVAALVCGLTGVAGYDAFDRFASAEYVAERIAPLLTQDTQLYSVEMYEQTLPFYLKRTMTLVNHRDELDFGLSQEPERWIPTLSQFQARWDADARAVAVMPPSTFDKLRAIHLPMQVVLSDRRFVVIRKP